MAMFDNPNRITEVLLADGWHPVMEQSFTLSGLVSDPATEFGFIRYIDREAQERIRVGGLLRDVFAVKVDSRMVGQIARRYVQPDGHLQVLLADGEWHDVPEVV